MIKSFSLLLIALINVSLFSPIIATDYYISSSTGNDRSTGLTRQTPWRSLKQALIVANRFRAGDNIYLCQGDVFPYQTIMATQTGTARQPITWTSYQCGTSTAKPIVSSSINIRASAWAIRGDMLKFDASSDTTLAAAGVRAVWVGEQRYLPARYPNLRNIADARLTDTSEFIYNEPSGITENKLRSPRLNQANNYWVGATVYMRTSNWIYTQTKVVASAPGWVQVANVPANDARCSGFYLEQSIDQYSRSALLQPDMGGEYVFNADELSLYIKPQSEQIKQDILAGRVTVWYLYANQGPAAVISGAYNIIDGIEFKYTPTAIQVQSRSTFAVRRTTIQYATGWGITSTNAPDSVVENNFINNVDGDCIWVDSPRGMIQNNVVQNCGMIAGYGFGFGAATTGIVTVSANVVGNTIRNTGYSGITPHGANRIAFNTISGVMKTLNDGGGIYMFGSSGRSAVVEGNVIEDVTGNYLAWTPWNIASCVFTDQGTSYVTIYNNTCKAAPQCMQLNSARENMILSNFCDSPGIYLNDFDTGSPIGYHGIIGNVVVTSGTNTNLQNPIHRIKSPDNRSLGPVATFYMNTYCEAGNYNGNTDYKFQKDFGWEGQRQLAWRYNTFDDWRASECGGPGADLSRCGFESASMYRYGACNTLRPWFFGASIEQMRDAGHIILAQEAADRQKYIIGGTIGGVAAIALIIAIAVLAIRRSKKQSTSASSPVSSMTVEQSFGSLDSPASGEFELVVTPEMQRGFSWSAASIQNAAESN